MSANPCGPRATRPQPRTYAHTRRTHAAHHGPSLRPAGAAPPGCWWSATTTTPTDGTHYTTVSTHAARRLTTPNERPRMACPFSSLAPASRSPHGSGSHTIHHASALHRSRSPRVLLALARCTSRGSIAAALFRLSGHPFGLLCVECMAPRRRESLGLAAHVSYVYGVRRLIIDNVSALWRGLVCRSGLCPLSSVCVYTSVIASVSFEKLSRLEKTLRFAARVCVCRARDLARSVCKIQFVRSSRSRIASPTPAPWALGATPACAHTLRVSSRSNSRK